MSWTLSDRATHLAPANLCLRPAQRLCASLRLLLQAHPQLPSLDMRPGMGVLSLWVPDRI